MKLDLYQIDAFSSKSFEGNPAAVCSLNEWLPDDVMQQIAAENNLAETAFFVKEDERYRIRWFTPAVEVDLCGHATLASAFVLFNRLGYQGDQIQFISNSGVLIVSQRGELLELNFPAQPGIPCTVPQQIMDAFKAEPKKCLMSVDLIVVFDDEETVLNANPNQELLKQIESRGVIVTSQSLEFDFIARFFAPNVGIAEDPVTGSAYTQLVPYWSAQLGKSALHAKQVCEYSTALKAVASGYG